MASVSCTSFLSEREQVIGRLERGMYVTRYTFKKKPEKKLLMVRRETLTLVWTRIVGSASASDRTTISMSSGADRGQGGSGVGGYR